MANRNPSNKMVRAQQPVLAFRKDPLELTDKRPQVPNYALRGTVYQRGRVLSKYALNWLAFRALAIMLEKVFTDKSEEYAAVRAEFKAAGINLKPRALHFELLRRLVAVYPGIANKAELADELGISITQLEQALHYLRDFGEITVGLSILPDGQGGAGIATLDIWVSYQNMITQQQVGLERLKQRQGSTTVPAAQQIHVREQLPTIQPELFALEDAEVNLNASD